MRLLLKAVPPSRGLHWMRDALRLYARRPLSFALLFLSFAFAVLAVSLLPFVGPVLQMMSLPLLSLGFMIASRSALSNGPVRPGQFIEGLRGDAERRRRLLLLCVIYGLAAIAVLALCYAVAGDAMQRMEVLLARGNMTQAEIDALRADPSVLVATLLVAVLGSLLSVPFWHAPALVHWGAQGVGQALFSSTLAVWRCRGAFFVYGLCFTGAVFATSLVSLVLGQLLGSAQLLAMLLAFSALTVSTVFYVSLLFTFNDSFAPAPD